MLINEIIQGDCLEVMKTFQDNHFSAIVTDPPYGLKFMGKEWDHGIPGIAYWQEALRISKPGSFLLAFGGTRTHHRLTCAIEDAGWEIRDCLMWLYGSGFPKGKGCLKPAWEPIILARKKGPKPGLNIDECRIGDGQDKAHSGYGHDLKTLYEGGLKWNGTDYSKGRWPANLILDEEAGQILDKQSGPCKTGDLTGQPRVENKIYGKAGSTIGKERYYKSDAATGASRFFYCPKASTSERNEGLEALPKIEKPLMGEFKENPGRKTPKSSPTARANYHPCVKPLKLMEYLIKLVMPPQNGLLLDPFAGSGTTILAAQNMSIEAIGIEKEEEYCKIATSRLSNKSLKC